MRKLLVLLAAVALVVAFTVPATAFESEFGGYWRTRAYQNTDFSGDDTGSADITEVDTRTRLYYTAKFSDDLKFVNKFEWNSTWGDDKGGDIGTDGMGIFRIKNSYVDFNLQAFNFKIGAQGTALARGFIFDDDHMGAVITYKGGGFTLPIIWIKTYEGGKGLDANDQDVDYYAISPSFKAGGLSINPYLMMVQSADVSAFEADATLEGASVTYIGVDLNAKFGAVSAWLTAISESGSVDLVAGGSYDLSGTLFALGAKIPLGSVGLHAQLFNASGDANAADTDVEQFMVPKGQSYYWSEIMGLGTFDNQASAGSPANGISNIMAYNIGVSFKPMDKMKITVDLWKANLNEEDAAGEDDLGTEINVKLTYKFLDNMTLDVVAAQLSAGCATGGGDSDPREIGTRLSIAF